MWQPTDWPHLEKNGVATSPTTTVGRTLDLPHTLFYQVYYQTAHIYVHTNTVYKVYTQVRQLCKTTCILLLYFATPTLSVALFKFTSRLGVVLQSFLMLMSCYFVHSVSIYTCAIRYSLSLYVYSTIAHTIEIEPNFTLGYF